MTNDIDDTSALAVPIPELTAKVTVSAPGVEISRPVNDETMSAVISILFGASRTAPPYMPTQAPSIHASQATSPSPVLINGGDQFKYDSRLTLGEFLTETQAKTFPQKICAAGYFLTEVKGQSDFSKDEVKQELVRAREDMPANYNRDWSSAVSSSFVHPEDGDATRFYVPKTGRTAVESNFADLGKRRAPRRTTKKPAGSNGDAE